MKPLPFSRADTSPATAVPLDRDEIKTRLRDRHGSMAAFERLRGLPEGSVADVLRGRGVRRAAEAVAQDLGIPLHAVSGLYLELSRLHGVRQRRRTPASDRD